MFDAPPKLQTTVFATVPAALHMKGKVTEWMSGRPHAAPTSFLEGPSFDREGNLYCTDIPYGRIFKVTPKGEFSLVAEYDGEPNGLKLHKDGYAILADKKRGLMRLDVKTGAVSPHLLRVNKEGLKGPNDLVFSANGDLYFTDQGETGLHDPTGRLIRLAADGKAEILMDNIPSPNGVALSPDGGFVYVAVTRDNAVWRVPVDSSGAIGRVSKFIQLSGGSGPDGLAVDRDGNLAICHTGLGTVWQFSPRGEPIRRIMICTGGTSVTNLAYGGADNKTLFILDTSKATIVRAEMDVPGLPLYSHAA